MKINMWMQRFTYACLLILISSIALCQLKVADVFSSQMVLQRSKPVPIWGSSAPGAVVQVMFAGQQVATTADATGKWQLQLQPLTANATPASLTIISGNDRLQLNDMLVGDVWLCSGQSNMEYPIDRRLRRYAGPARGEDVAALEVQNPNRPDAIRYLYVERTLNKYPGLPTTGWAKGADTSINHVSAIGYFFAKEVYPAVQVPIGIISSSWGGTRIEQWTQPDAYRNSPVFGKTAAGDTFRIDGLRPGQMMRGMIEPLVPLAIKGVLWYQGESNCIIEDQDTYAEKMRLMQNNWRTLFGDTQLPFYTVQIAPCLYSARKDAIAHSPELLPAFWEAQTDCVKLPNTYMMVTTDLVDNLKDIHPSYKWVIAHRLAGQALANTYGKTGVEVNSPQFGGMKRKKATLVLTFNYAGNGLQSSNGKPITGFEIAGKDGKFVQASATPQGNTVVLNAASIAKPKQARFAWHETAMPNLVNSEGLPAIPFRTKR